MSTDQPSRRDYLAADEAGESARRAHRPITAVPHFGNGHRGRVLAESWRNGWERVDASRKAVKA